MSGVHKPDLDAGEQGKPLLVFAALQMAQGGLGILHRIKGLHQRTARPAALLIGPVGVALLDMGAVQQHNPHQVPGEPGGYHRAVIAQLTQQREAAGVVDVGVGHQNAVHLAGGKGTIVVLHLVPALLETAVYQNALSASVNTMAAAGDRAGSAEKCQLHKSVILPNHKIPFCAWGMFFSHYTTRQDKGQSIRRGNF